MKKKKDQPGVGKGKTSFYLLFKEDWDKASKDLLKDKDDE